MDGNWRGMLAAMAGVLAATPAAAAPVTAGSGGIWEIISHADPIVKGVMLVLLVASVATWGLWFAKLGELRSAKAALGHDIALLGPARTLAEGKAASYPATREMIEVAGAELAASGPNPSPRAIEGVEERFAAQLPIVEARAAHRVLRGTNVIASIGATAPFVGLAGTVWGIMNSFLGIASTKSTSLAVVAPGIAEALFATALGLAVAIPAVLIYNSLARSIAGYRRLLNEAAVLAACLLSRELERQGDAPRPNGIDTARARPTAEVTAR